MSKNSDQILTHQQELDSWREQVDQIDAQLAQLLAKRAYCAEQIIQIKQQVGQEILQPDREQAVINHVLSTNHAPLPAESLKKIYSCIIEEMRHHQKNWLATNPR
jgi:chorismate mutase